MAVPYKLTSQLMTRAEKHKNYNASQATSPDRNHQAAFTNVDSRDACLTCKKKRCNDCQDPRKIRKQLEREAKETMEELKC